jgi:NAD(P)-dependent dehydrogenase (short-subunit alcohol dehydrogenase family)
MSSVREAGLCVLQDEDGAEETELVTIEWDGNRPPVMVVPKGCQPRRRSGLSSTGARVFTTSRAALFLAWDDAAFITGVALTVDGGRHLL